MTFTEINAAYVELRNSLGSFVGENSIQAVNIKPPANNRGEASFLRLVNWSYVLLYESGRVAIPYLLKVPIKRGRPSESLSDARQLVHLLRTWNSHNIGFSDEDDAAMTRRVYRWFVSHGGIPQSSDDELWQRCFEGLCLEVGAVIAHCQGAVMWAIDSSDDGKTVITDLQRRLDRNWAAVEFDRLIEDACVRIGQRIDVPKFREPRLPKWRTFLATVHEDDSPESRMIAMIEKDLLDHIDETLPIDGRDVMTFLQLDSGPEVGEALRRAREHFRSGTRNRNQLLNNLAKEYETKSILNRP